MPLPPLFQAAYAAFWGDVDGATPLAKVCDKYTGSSKDICIKVKDDVNGKKGDIEKELRVEYMKFGPMFGASADFCKAGECCPNKLPKTT